MAINATGPLIRNIIERANLDESDRNRLEVDMSRGVYPLKIAEQYTGPLKNIQIKSNTLWKNNDKVENGYMLVANYRNITVMEYVDKLEEELIHGIAIDIPESHISDLKGKTLAEIVEFDNVMSEFWSGTEVITGIISEKNPKNIIYSPRKKYLTYEVLGLRKQYL